MLYTILLVASLSLASTPQDPAVDVPDEAPPASKYDKDFFGLYEGKTIVLTTRDAVFKGKVVAVLDAKVVLEEASGNVAPVLFVDVVSVEHSAASDAPAADTDAFDDGAQEVSNTSDERPRSSGGNPKLEALDAQIRRATKRMEEVEAQEAAARSACYSFGIGGALACAGGTVMNVSSTVVYNSIPLLGLGMNVVGCSLQAAGLGSGIYAIVKFFEANNREDDVVHARGRLRSLREEREEMAY